MMFFGLVGFWEKCYFFMIIGRMVVNSFIENLILVIWGNMVDFRVGMELKVWKENLKRDYKVYMKYFWIEIIRRIIVFLGVIIIVFLMIYVFWNLVIKVLVLEIVEVDILNC